MSVFLSTQPDPEAMMSALDREVIHKAFMLEMDFASGPVRVSDWNVPFTAGGHEWKGLGDLVGMSDFGGGSDLAPYREYQLGLPKDLVGYSEGRIPELIGNRSDYLGRSAKLWMQIFDPVSLDAHGRRVPLGDPFAMDYGVMSKVSATFVPGVPLYRSPWRAVFSVLVSRSLAITPTAINKGGIPETWDWVLWSRCLTPKLSSRTGDVSEICARNTLRPLGLGAQ